jgi:hypothetical protein
MAQDAQADIVRLDHGAVVLGAGHRDLELARQVVELGMQARPLTQDQLGGRARILDLVLGDAGEMIGRDVADAVSRGLDRVHLDIGEQVENVGDVAQLRPVELEISARGEMAVAAVIALADQRELAHLLRGKRAVGHRDPQHIGVELQIDAVLQAQRRNSSSVSEPLSRRPTWSRNCATRSRTKRSSNSS